MNKVALFIFILFLLFTSPLGAEASNLAFLEIQNLNGTSDLDYLKGMISGILLFDFSSADGVTLVDRRNIDSILDEQKLRLSGLTEGSEALLEIGKLGAADSLLKGTYVFLGTELLVSLSLLDTTDGSQKIFTGRGHTENMLHQLAEEIVLHLSGEVLAFQNPDSQRSILSLRDETPGRITFYSPMVGGEIWLDGEFFGYTTGNGREPTLLEGLAPGTHNVQVRMGIDFGMVHLPEFTFEPWNSDVEVKAGKNKVLRDGTVGLNGFIYQAMALLRETEWLPEDFRGEYRIDQEYAYEDRGGNPRSGAFSITLNVDENLLSAGWTLSFIDESFEDSVTIPWGEDVALEGEIGDVKWNIELEYTQSRQLVIEYSLLRTDIWQSMYR